MKATLGCWTSLPLSLQPTSQPCRQPRPLQQKRYRSAAAGWLRLLVLLAGRADVLLSDAAPKLTGVRDRDRALEEELLLGVNEALGGLLQEGGSLLLKVLQGPEAQELERRIRSRFESAKQVKTAATRKGSTERYLLARGFKT